MGFMSKAKGLNDPVIIVVNGNPLGSSLLNMALENGPFLFDNETKTFKENPHSWNNQANVFYIESTSITGLS